MSKLREYRLSKGLSQEDVAKAVGVQKAMISRVEQGKRIASMSLVARLVDWSGGKLKADDFLPRVAQSEAAA
jgi:transcriptional regulator with XRE-family HTH domain